MASNSIPMCDLLSQYRMIQPEIEAAIARVLNSGQVINGPEVTAFEEEIAPACGSKFAVGCGSGTDAILLALAALQIGPGDEVILPPFTFFATVGSICRIGATPVFADIDPVTYNLSPEEVAKKITSRTKAIMPVHLYGQCADMAPLQDLAQSHNLHIIEDAAQSFGAEYQGRRCGGMGTIGSFSFYPSKNLGTYGDAGLCTTNSPELASRMKTLRNHGMEPKYFHKMIGWNARIDAIHAAILRVKLKYIEQWTVQRQAVAARYDEIIQNYRLNSYLDSPVAAPNRRHVWNQYVIRVADRDGLVAHLKANQIGCEIYYPLPLHLQECMQFLGHTPGDFPVSEAAARHVLALPMYPELSESLQVRVIESCSAFLRTTIRRAA
ncbi:DegT/DnrJ/EryC1/StrS family aminotransferase [Tuwongella immobilis]|uniref:Uncharacterized protein n=1 Tax=Tuwongella immobilis TaxID=692036 RepID=A0A6C2YNI9_9BACT|nr:DegT/DnrJ/EryC1/StrS family aminotransferase [Tuwongella immobilis]VIP03190.1 glutamine--scyllo-inositol transaminase : Glutamine--scyllo-inositol transaminase OS=Isosphaera pallida (strain ATCC 43644 / DSM 9630 / IS1B) GN=Isop_1639 PE=3 SV=1: DegT_DnrJ_EryC1 [Tuwongella immobilis]VTS03657.1 glutamine--scyllo-inositol transaminase : Glutamine--scyllo-inositol transaminase OS=Isosphaera pallida (strain ATCC 43644 / DSM 9630 / IS1B) GN=Isop_1639 PE=3 SV=1: DegT_DnrJ_EryC1 [Tuwongella immobilis]